MARWGMLVDLRRCSGCGACMVACQLENGQKPGISWNRVTTREWGEEPGACGRAYVPHACKQCEDAPCVAVCPTGASAQRDDGVVTVDYEACIGCGACLDACPYGARVANTVEDNYFDAAEPAPYESYGVQRSGVVEKCTFCHDRMEEGRKPACVHNCTGAARVFGDLDDPESEISRRIAEGDAIRIDQSSFYYIPVAGMGAEQLPFAANDTFPTKR